MTIEYSQHQLRPGITHAYGFSAWEMEILMSGIPKAIKKLERKIERLENHPKNEGQATYWAAIRDHSTQIENLKEIQRVFSEVIEEDKALQQRKKNMKTLKP